MDIVERLRFHGRYATETQEQCAVRKNAERDEAAAELARLRNIIMWCQRRLPTEGYKQAVDRFLSGEATDD